MALSTKQQIKILKRVRKSFTNGWGLCFNIQKQLLTFNKFTRITISSNPDAISDLIPLFTFKNAEKTFLIENWSPKPTNPEAYWWPINDRSPRMLFLDWMINQLEEQLVEETKKSIFTKIKKFILC